MKRFLSALLIFLILIQNTLVVYWDDMIITGQEIWSMSTISVTTHENYQEETTEELSVDGNQEADDDKLPILLNDTWYTQENTVSLWWIQEEALSTSSITWSLLDDLFFWSWDADLHSGISIFLSGMLHLAQNISGINTGITQTWQQSAKLFITEYFYHTKNSFVEITNLLSNCKKRPEIRSNHSC